MALGYQNPFYLKQAQKKQQVLYNGKVLLDKHDPSTVYDSKEKLQHAQESRLKMKQQENEIKPANYERINKLSEVRNKREKDKIRTKPDKKGSVAKPRKVKNSLKQAAKAQSWKFPVCYDDDDEEESSNPLNDNIISELPPYSAVTTTEPIDSLIMEDEHLDTISATELDEVIKSCVENLVPNPSESEGENGCDVLAGFTTFSNVLFDDDYDSDSSDDQSFSVEDVREKIYSNPLFDEEIIPMEIDQHSLNAESDVVESMPNHDSSFTISSKIDSLFDEFAGELTLLKSFPPGIDETDCHPEKEIRLTKRLLYDNSSPRPLEEIVSDISNAGIESFSPSHIPNKDSDSHMEEINLFLNPDDPMPPSIKEDDDDSERDILILEELLDNYSLSFPTNESYHFDIPSPYRPPAKPPDGNTGTLNIKMLGGVSDQKKKQEEKQLEEAQTAKAQNWKFPVCYDDDDDEESSKYLNDNIISELPSYSAVTPTEPIDSLSMGDEHLNTIPATKSDEFIKSCVENLVPNPSESEGENKCDVPAGFTTFSNVLFDDNYDFDSSDDQSLFDEAVREKIYLNPLFDEEIIPMEIDQHSLNAESDLIESMPNHDSSVTISSKIDSLFDEFAGELTLLKSFPPGIDKPDCHPEKEIRLTKRLLYDNSSPRPPEEIVSDISNADIESFSPSPIPNKDSDPHMEEIDLFLNPDDPMPSGIEDDDYDSERDIQILKELLDNYSLSLPTNESYHFYMPSPYRPPAKPPDGNTGTLNIKMMGDVFDQKVPIPNPTITRILNQEKSPDLFSHQGFEAFQSSAECPMIINGKNIPLLDVPLFYFYPP
nr:Gag-Pol polyprotein [Tanacetum cinerariifolium]